MTEAAQLTKRCTKCGEEKVLDGFPLKASCRGGRDTKCKNCIAEYTAGWRLQKKLAQPIAAAAAEKACLKCGAVKPLGCYRKNNYTRDKRDAACQECRSEAKPKPVALDGHKFCGVCGEQKPFSEFHKHRRGSHGLDSKCKHCKKESDAKKYAKQAEGVEHRDGCQSPADCVSLSHKLCRTCTQLQDDVRQKHVARMTALAATDEWRERLTKWNHHDAGFQEKRISAIKSYYERRRENEEFEAFMARMEREAEEAVSANVA